MKNLLMALVVVLTGSSANSFDSFVDQGKTTQLTFSNGVQAQLTWTQLPVVGKEASLTIDWKNASGPFKGPSNFKVVLWMPEHGHGSSPTLVQPVTVAGKPVLGSFKVSKMIFSMPGNWEVRVVVKHNATSEETQAAKLEL